MNERLSKLNAENLKPTEILKKVTRNPAQPLAWKFLAALIPIMCILHGGADYIVERVLWFSVYSTKSQIMSKLLLLSNLNIFIAHAERDGTRAETRFLLSPKRTSPFKSVGASVQSTAGSRGVRISLSNAG